MHGRGDCSPHAVISVLFAHAGTDSQTTDYGGLETRKEIPIAESGRIVYF